MMKKAYFIFEDEESNEKRVLFKLSFIPNNKDVTFIDYAIKKSHISFHKDNSVWLTPHGPGSKNIFKKNNFFSIWLISRKLKKQLSPFLAYHPLEFSKYPIAKQKHLQNSIIYKGSKNTLKKCFIINSIFKGKANTKIPNKIVDTINEIGNPKIGSKQNLVLFDTVNNIQTQLNTYTPIELGPYRFHPCLIELDQELDSNHASIFLLRLFNYSKSPKYLLENLHISLFQNLPKRVLLRYFKSNNLDIAEIVFNI